EEATARVKSQMSVIFDGFYQLSAAEIDLVVAIAYQAPVTITLPEWPGSVVARQRLLGDGFLERPCTNRRRASSSQTFSAANIESECEEIARRILAEATKGRPLREIGVLLRVRDPYAPLLETILARFGIPARFYFADPLGSHPAVAYLTRLVRAQ